MRVKLSYLLVFVLGILIIPTTVNAQTATNASDLKTQMTDLKTDRKNAISQIKERTKAEIEAMKVQFRERLQIIKDARKKVIVQKIYDDIAAKNKRHTDKFNEVLARLQAFLDKISADVKDSKTLTDIKAAQAKIDAAKEAIATQAAKEYIIEIIDEETLRKKVGSIIIQFRIDLMQVHKLVIDARQAVQTLRTDKLMIKKEASSSANL